MNVYSDQPYIYAENRTSLVRVKTFAGFAA